MDATKAYGCQKYQSCNQTKLMMRSFMRSKMRRFSASGDELIDITICHVIGLRVGRKRQ